MAIDSYMFFMPYSGNPAYLPGESQVDMANLVTGDTLGVDFQSAFKAKGLFEVQDYGFDTEQAFNMSSQSSGIGAGKITFNAFSITRKIDRASPTFFEMSCNGTAFKKVALGLRKSAGESAGTDVSGLFFLRFDFKLVGVKTIAYAHDDESPKETITFVYGALQVRYLQQNNDGTPGTVFPAGWNQQQNKKDLDFTNVIANTNVS